MVKLKDHLRDLTLSRKLDWNDLFSARLRGDEHRGRIRLRSGLRIVQQTLGTAISEESLQELKAAFVEYRGGKTFFTWGRFVSWLGVGVPRSHVDPESMFPSLPQPYQRISEVFEEIFDSAWSMIAEKHDVQPAVSVPLADDETRKPVLRLKEAAPYMSFALDAVPTAVSRSSDGKFFLVGTDAGALYVANAYEGRELCTLDVFKQPASSLENAAAILANPGVVAASSFCRSPEVVREEAAEHTTLGAKADRDMRQNQVAKSVNRFVPYLFAVAGAGKDDTGGNGQASNDGGGDNEDASNGVVKQVGIVKVFEFWVRPPRLVEVARASFDGMVAGVEMSADLRYISVAMKSGALHIVTLPANVRPVFHAKSGTFVHPAAMKEYQKLYEAGTLGVAGGRELGAAAASKNPIRVPEEEEEENDDQEDEDQDAATETKGADLSAGGDTNGREGAKEPIELADADFVFTLKPTRNDVMHHGGEETQKAVGTATCHFVLASVERKVAIPLVTLASLSEKEKGSRGHESRGAHGVSGTRGGVSASASRSTGALHFLETQAREVIVRWDGSNRFRRYVLPVARAAEEEQRELAAQAQAAGIAEDGGAEQETDAEAAPTGRAHRRVLISELILPAAITSSALDGSFSMLATGLEDGTVIIWDVLTGSQRALLERHPGHDATGSSVDALAFYQQRYIVSGARDGTVRVNDLLRAVNMNASLSKTKGDVDKRARRAEEVLQYKRLVQVGISGSTHRLVCARSDLKEGVINISCTESIPIAVVSTASSTTLYDISSGTPICNLARTKAAEAESWRATAIPILAGNEFFLSTSTTAGSSLQDTREELLSALQGIREAEIEHGGEGESELTAAKEDAAAAWDAFKGCRRCSTNVSISFVWDVLCDAYPSFAKAITAATGFDRPTATKQIFLLSTSEQRKDPEARLELLLMGPPGMRAQPYGIHARTEELLQEAGGEGGLANGKTGQESALVIGTAGVGGGRRHHNSRHQHHKFHNQESSLPTHFGVQSGASLLSQDLMLSQQEARTHTKDTVSREMVSMAAGDEGAHGSSSLKVVPREPMPLKAPIVHHSLDDSESYLSSRTREQKRHKLLSGTYKLLKELGGQKMF